MSINNVWQSQLGYNVFLNSFPLCQTCCQRVNTFPPLVLTQYLKRHDSAGAVALRHLLLGRLQYISCTFFSKHYDLCVSTQSSSLPACQARAGQMFRLCPVPVAMEMTSYCSTDRNGAAADRGKGETELTTQSQLLRHSARLSTEPGGPRLNNR